MEIGIDSFASATGSDGNYLPSDVALELLLERIEAADKFGLDVFGVGEHHRREFLDSANAMILAAAASRTKNIKLMSAVTVLSAADPVRVFQNFATLDLISKGKAEIVVGRGSFIEAFPLFGYRLEDYDEVFTEKLDLLLNIRESDGPITWSGKFRPALNNVEVFPKPLQDRLPIWLGVGGTPQSFIRAGRLGMPLMVAIIGGETHRFKPLIDLYREAGVKAGYSLDELKVGLHSLGYVGESREKAIEEFYPGYAAAFTKIGKERGWPPVTRSHFDSQTGTRGALVVGGPEDVAEKLIRHSESLGGVSRFTFQMDSAALSREQLLRSIELVGTMVKPAINQN
jgi:probable LLM family oxidoreductase